MGIWLIKKAGKDSGKKLKNDIVKTQFEDEIEEAMRLGLYVQ